MISISRETDYAARVILHLALQGDDVRATAADIAQLRLIPKSLVRRVVTRLAVAGLIVTTRGNTGGITLARPPAEISLLEVVEAMEGPVVLNICTVQENACPLMPACNVHTAWCQARNLLREHLQAVTFDRLAHPSATTGAPLSP